MCSRFSPSARKFGLLILAGAHGFVLFPLPAVDSCLSSSFVFFLRAVTLEKADFSNLTVKSEMRMEISTFAFSPFFGGERFEKSKRRAEEKNITHEKAISSEEKKKKKRREAET